MDTDNSPAPLSVPGRGGSVEPANKAAVVKDRLRASIDAAVERYELRDPFAEVTYRADTFQDMAAKAEQIGSHRFTSIDAQGRRTNVRKVDGEWQRGSEGAAAPERTAAAEAARSDSPRAIPVAQILKPFAAPKADVAEPVVLIDAQAERAAQIARIEAALVERYVIKRAPVSIGDLAIGRTEYRFRGDTSRVAFTESTFRLATDMNSPSVARSMVDVAEARNWRALRVSGNEDFKRMVWLEASARGVRTIGYEPNPADLELLKRERESRLVNRIEPARRDSQAPPPATPDKPSGRGGGGRKTVLAAIEAVLVAKRVPEVQREAVMAAAAEKLVQRLRDGQTLKVRVYDKAAPSQRPIVTPSREVQRTRERAAPAR